MFKIKIRLKFLPFLLIVFCFGQNAVFASDPAKADLNSAGNPKTRLVKPPVIIIPGILGSELINEKTGEKVWFRVSRSADDDLRLPVSVKLSQSRDNLLPGDMIRKIAIPLLPDVKVYQEIVDSLTNTAGYKEASWDNPPKDLNGRFFVFPYDWRRDNIETARNLINKIDHLRARSKTPRTKFVILAHSMGGLIARYAAMYGRMDIPKGNPNPTWIGEKYFNKIFLFGTPNEGSAEALESILLGRNSLGGVTNLPFVRDLSPLDIATMPSVFQLLPHENTLKIYDENLKPVKIDIYKIESWQTYGWAVFNAEKDYLKEYSPAERGRFEEYFSIALTRAKRFQQALRAPSRKKSSIQFHIVGSQCADTLDGFVIYRDKNRWVTMTRPASFKTSTGTKISSETVKSLIMVPGDGKVAKRSLLAETFSNGSTDDQTLARLFPVKSELFVCERHDSLMVNVNILGSVFKNLAGEEIE